MRLAREFARDMLQAAAGLVASRPAAGVLATLLLVDFLFLALHVCHVFAAHFWAGSLPADRSFSLEQERSYSEWYEYAKTLACMLTLALCYLRRQQPAYAALSVVFAILLADNALGLHEHAGTLLSGTFGWAGLLFDSGPQAMGELSFFLLLGLGTTVMLAAAFRRSGREHRATAGLCLLLILVLAGFGVGVDLLHAAVSGWYRLDRLFGAIEDGGELVVLSGLVTVSVAILAQLMQEGSPRAAATSRRPFSPAAPPPT
jgi:hypothetical protein